MNVSGIISSSNVWPNSNPPVPTLFRTGFTFGFTRNDTFDPLGCKFTIGPNPITVYEIGFWNIAGNTLSHQVKITNTSYTTIVSTNVSTLGQPAGDVFGAITPTVLSANTSYYMFVLFPNSTDISYDRNKASCSYVISSWMSAYAPGGVISDVTLGEMYVPVNFKFYR